VRFALAARTPRGILSEGRQPALRFVAASVVRWLDHRSLQRIPAPSQPTDIVLRRRSASVPSVAPRTEVLGVPFSAEDRGGG
jgi:hypothetical protein